MDPAGILVHIGTTLKVTAKRVFTNSDIYSTFPAIPETKIDGHFFITFKRVSTNAFERADLIATQGFLVGYKYD